MMGLALATCLHILPKNTPYKNTVTRISCKNHIDPRLTEAIIQTESRNRKWVVKKERDGKKSYGLMQIKLETARMMGFKGGPKRLMIPWINIFYGVRYLRLQMKSHPFLWDAVSAYNAGRILWITRSLHYGNSLYLRRVAAHYWQLMKRRGRVASPEDQRIDHLLSKQGGIIILSYHENLSVSR